MGKTANPWQVLGNYPPCLFSIVCAFHRRLNGFNGNFRNITYLPATLKPSSQKT